MLSKVVVLDRVEPGVEPDYCVHGRTTCYACSQWCWLGDKTYPAVSSGEVLPVCRQCMTRAMEQLRETGDEPTLLGNMGDHRRADGPHD